MHHLPAGPPLSARVAEALTRWAVLGRRVHLRRSGRLALGVMVSAVVTALVLAIPVVAGTGTGTGSPLTGSDGRPVPSAAFAGLTSAATLSSATEESSVVPSATGTSVEDVPTTSPSATGTSIEDVPTTSPSAIGRLPSAPASTAPKPAVPGPGSASDSPAEPVTAAGAKVAAPEPSTSATPAAPATPVAPVTTPAGPEAEVLALVNAERAAVGCEALAADVELAAVARAHSEDMRDRGFFDHVNLDGLDPFERAEAAGVTARAENIARGQQNATDVMAAWMDSSGHRANILDCGLTHLGIGVASGGGGPWWTQLFA